MRKVGIVLGVVGLLGGGWAGACEHLARKNAHDYFKAREIPGYHALSLHGRDDMTLIGGFCRPCATKAQAVVAAEAGKEADALNRELESTLSGGRR